MAACSNGDEPSKPDSTAPATDADATAGVDTVAGADTVAAMDSRGDTVSVADTGADTVTDTSVGTDATADVVTDTIADTAVDVHAEDVGVPCDVPGIPPWDTGSTPVVDAVVDNVQDTAPPGLPDAGTPLDAGASTSCMPTAPRSLQPPGLHPSTRFACSRPARPFRRSR